ncbi:hypothetical protein SEA_LEOPARD_81 [Mycobacterium phage Leopard]|nr:hypothetical protein SEA_LEOPARD_81 [Mycobacterium phage Leopard]
MASRGERGQSDTNSPEYQRNHKKLRQSRGQPWEYDCVDCKMRKGRDWAYIHDTDPSDVRNYKPLCRLCHQAYDRPAWLIEERRIERERIEQTNAFKGWTPERREAQRQRMLAKWAQPGAKEAQAIKCKSERPWESRRLMSGGGL